MAPWRLFSLIEGCPTHGRAYNRVLTPQMKMSLMVTLQVKIYLISSNVLRDSVKLPQPRCDPRRILIHIHHLQLFSHHRLSSLFDHKFRLYSWSFQHILWIAYNVFIETGLSFMTVVFHCGIVK